MTTIRVEHSQGYFQGELYIGPVEEIDESVLDLVVGSRIGEEFVVGHSETGHHHVVSASEALLFETANPMIAYIVAQGEHVDLVHKRDHDTHPTLRLGMGAGDGGALVGGGGGGSIGGGGDGGDGKKPGKRRLGRKVTRQREVAPEASGSPTRWTKAAD